MDGRRLRVALYINMRPLSNAMRIRIQGQMLYLFVYGKCAKFTESGFNSWDDVLDKELAKRQRHPEGHILL